MADCFRGRLRRKIFRLEPTRTAANVGVCLLNFGLALLVNTRVYDGNSGICRMSKKFTLIICTTRIRQTVASAVSISARYPLRRTKCVLQWNRIFSPYSMNNNYETIQKYRTLLFLTFWNNHKLSNLNRSIMKRNSLVEKKIEAK